MGNPTVRLGARFEPMRACHRTGEGAQIVVSCGVFEELCVCRPKWGWHLDMQNAREPNRAHQLYLEWAGVFGFLGVSWARVSATVLAFWSESFLATLRS